MATRCQAQAGPGAGALQQLWSCSLCLAMQGHFQGSPHQLTGSCSGLPENTCEAEIRMRFCEHPFMRHSIFLWGAASPQGLQHPLKGHNIPLVASSHVLCRGVELQTWVSLITGSEQGDRAQKGLSSPQKSCLGLLLSQRALLPQCTFSLSQKFSIEMCILEWSRDWILLQQRALRG